MVKSEYIFKIQKNTLVNGRKFQMQLVDIKSPQEMLIKLPLLLNPQPRMRKDMDTLKTHKTFYMLSS